MNGLRTIVTRLNPHEYGELANYAVRNGMMLDTALAKLLKKGLIQVAIEAAAADKKGARHV